MINQVTLVGRLTRDPELKSTPDGTKVTQVTLAVNRNFRNHNGEIEADFISCILWRKTAENTANYCRKGSIVGVTGRLHTRNYESSGKKVYVTEVVAETIRFLSSKPHETEKFSKKADEPPLPSPPPERTFREEMPPEQTFREEPPSERELVKVEDLPF